MVLRTPQRLNDVSQSRKRYVYVVAIGLVHDYVTRSKFITKPHFREFFQTTVNFVLFSRGYSFHGCYFGDLTTVTLAICVLILGRIS